MALDLNRALLFARAANAIYDRTGSRPACDTELASYGFSNIRHFDGSGWHAALMDHKTEGLVLDNEGTEFTQAIQSIGEGKPDWEAIRDTIQNIDQSPRKLAGGIVPAGYLEPSAAVCDAVFGALTSRSLKIIGHSQGAVMSIQEGVILASREIVVDIYAFAPPKAGDSAFWSGLRILRDKGLLSLTIYAREHDFAPSWAPISINGYLQGAPLQWSHGGKVEQIDSWSILNESVEDHMPEKYVSDYVALVARS